MLGGTLVTAMSFHEARWDNGKSLRLMSSILASHLVSWLLWLRIQDRPLVPRGAVSLSSYAVLPRSNKPQFDDGYVCRTAQEYSAKAMASRDMSRHHIGKD